ncbi:MAG: SufD family Fe-S cluster assembly protein [Oligoflexales bacterium]
MHHSFESAYQGQGPSSLPQWVGEFRERARADVSRMGFPTRKTEGWQATNLKEILSQVYQLPEAPSQLPDLSRWKHEDEETLVFVDGQLLRGGEHPETTFNYSHLKSDQSDVLRHTISAGRALYEDTFTRLHDAFLQSGVLIDVPKGKKKHIHLIHLLTPAGQQAALSRVSVRLQPQAEARLIETHIPLGVRSESFAGRLTDIVIEKGAQLEVLNQHSGEAMQNFVQQTRMHVERDASCRVFAATRGGKTVRHGFYTNLAGPGAEVKMSGMLFSQGEESLDCQTIMKHSSPHARSEQLFHGLARGCGRLNFRGLIQVAVGAHGTDAGLLNKNLLLDSQADVSCRPELQILNDDVKCHHGATVSELRREEVEYLKSRGIREPVAKKMLVEAFLSSVQDNDFSWVRGRLSDRWDGGSENV